MDKKIKILFNSFGRVEKILFFNLFLDDNFEIVGIISASDSEQLAYFLKQDSIHGKFKPNQISFQNSKKAQKIVFNKATQKYVDVYDAKKIDKKIITKIAPDFIIDLSNNIKFNELLSLSKLTNWMIGMYRQSFQKKKDFQLSAYGLNHIEINQEKNQNIILLPTIKTLIISILTKNFQNSLGINNLLFDNVRGVDNNNNLLDNLTNKTNKSLPLSRSAFDNIVPMVDSDTNESLKMIFEKAKINVLTEGSQLFVPVKTGCFLSITLNVNKIFKESEVNEILIKELDGNFAVSKDHLVSQDIVSNNYYGIMDINLTRVLNTKEDQIIRLGFWYDNETSEAISIFKTIQYISGLKQK